MLEVNNLHAKIGDKEILKDINLVIKDGEPYAIMGPNGSGKSVFSAVLVGNALYDFPWRRRNSSAFPWRERWGNCCFRSENVMEMPIFVPKM